MDVSFVTSAVELAGRPLPVLPEFAFIGRSNCGKSSLINHFLGRRKIAKTSGQPGKTQALNYFCVQDRYYVVDLPGYGYARISKARRAAWAKLIHAYLEVGDRPLAIFHLLDIRHQPSPEDVEVAQWLREGDHPVAVVLTKTDKVSKARHGQRFNEIITTLQLAEQTPFFPSSALKGFGRKEMHAWVEAVLTAARAEPDGQDVVGEPE